MSSDPHISDDGPMKGHRYDGIREYDNPMPGWWVWIFILSIIFAVIYVLGLHVFGFINSYEDDLAEGIENLEVMRMAYAGQASPLETDPAALAAIIEDPGAASLSLTNYATYCAACHGDEGQGLIGPNLTDRYWIHGGSNERLFEVISTGITDKGMPGWESVLSSEDRARLVALIRSMAGTNPPNAKEPQGELLE